MDDFLWRALLAGLGVAIVAGPFGCFVVWRGLAYYGETLAHTALFGVAIGLWLSIDVIWGMLGATVLAGLALGLGQRQGKLAGDTLLGILASSALAAGLVTVAAVPGVRVDLMAYLFGDILATRGVDLILLWGGGAAALVLLAALWRQALSATVHEELARIDGVPTQAVNLALMVLIVVCLFNSIRATLLVWLIVPLALIGVTGGLLITGQPFGFMALLGVLALAGEQIKNSIVVLSKIRVEMDYGKPPYQAILDGCVSKVRPVLMVALTTVLGSIPLLADPFFGTMAVCIMFGLSFACVLTLLVMPALYCIFFKVQEPAATKAGG